MCQHTNEQAESACVCIRFLHVRYSGDKNKGEKQSVHGLSQNGGLMKWRCKNDIPTLQKRQFKQYLNKEQKLIYAYARKSFGHRISMTGANSDYSNKAGSQLLMLSINDCLGTLLWSKKISNSGQLTFRILNNDGMVPNATARN